MAWQLIYTSAPRLLEAGRSGFGTVARHRAIHPLLVTAIERDSQFDRVAGGVVLAHRILTAGGSRYHVLTCIRDAGADYTGRTNHIAHHLIVEPREIAALGSAAPSPADVLAQMEWRPVWSDAPRWLDGGDEVALGRFRRQPGRASAWQAATGESRHAELLQPARAACLILPRGADVLAIFAESLGRSLAQSWQATFTTFLQTGDELADFRWLALPADSPLRANAENGRAILDLTAPHTLPIPPAQTFETAGAHSTSRVPDDASFPMSSPMGAAPAKIGNLFDEKLALATRPRRERGSRTAIWIGLAAAIVAVVAGGMFFIMRESDGVKNQRQQIRDTFRSVFSDETGAELAEVPAAKLDASIALARATEDTAAALKTQKSKLSPPLPQAEQPITLFNAGGTGLPVPETVSELFSLHGKFHAHQQELLKIEQSPVKAAQLDALHALRDQIEKADSKLLKRLAPHLFEDTRNAVEKLWADRLFAAIELPPGERTPGWFRKHFEALPSDLRNEEGGPKVEKLIEDWEAVVAAHGNNEKMEALLKERRHLWPAWLVTLANAGKPPPKRAIAADDPKKQEPDSSKEKKSSEEKKRFEGDLMIVLNPEKSEEWKVFAAELKKSGAEPWLKTPGAEGNGNGTQTARGRFFVQGYRPKEGVCLE